DCIFSSFGGFSSKITPVNREPSFIGATLGRLSCCASATSNIKSSLVFIFFPSTDRPYERHRFIDSKAGWISDVMTGEPKTTLCRCGFDVASLRKQDHFLFVRRK